MTMIKVWRIRTLVVVVTAVVIGLYLPATVRSLPDCGLSLSSSSSLLVHSSRRPRGHAFSSSSPPLSSGGGRLPGNLQVLSKRLLLPRSVVPTATSTPTTSQSTVKLRINNLLGAAATSRIGLASYPSSSGRVNATSNHHRLQQQRARRKGRIIMGRETDEGEFPWQASLQLLHPVLGFIGHWCGGVLIHQNWILTAAHCVHNDLFNLAMPEAWSVVLGEYDRHIESGREQRIAIDRIVMHDNYENYQHDVVLMRLSRPANMDRDAMTQKICLPFISTNTGGGSSSSSSSSLEATDDIDAFDGSANQLRKLHKLRNNEGGVRGGGGEATKGRRRNDKFNKERNVFNRVNEFDRKYVTNFNRFHFAFDKETPFKSKANDLPYRDCIATGWGMMTANGDLSDILLQSKVPLLSNRQCQRAYRGYVKIHSGHLCGGKVDGEGGTCVGDSGGPLQCRISKDGPWILAGITSFGWNCSENVPDVFTRISYYVNWINDTINERRRRR